MDLRKKVVDLSIDDVLPNRFQPRIKFNEDSLNELSESIKEHGVIQPIVVRPVGDKYEIIAGERRYRASKIAGLTKIPAIIRNFTDEQMMEIALLENLQRENLNAIEEAIAYKKMIQNLGITQEELAKKVGKSRSHVTNIIGLLRLPQEVQQLVADSKISMGHARALSKLESEEEMKALANKIIDEHLPVRQTEEDLSSDKIEKKVKISRVNNNSNTREFKYVEDLLRDKLDTKVRIKEKKIEISFTNVADLNRILEVLNVKE